MAKKSKSLEAEFTAAAAPATSGANGMKAVEADDRFAEARELMAKIPNYIKFGASTWTYPGWRGSIYFQEYSSESQFRRESLREYCSYPLFRSVGVDSFFYSPPSPKLLATYAEQVPQEFKWVAKMWEVVTIPKFPTHARYGGDKGKINERFLDLNKVSTFVEPLREPAIKSHCGPLVLQFPYVAATIMGADDFLDRLEAFLIGLPKDFQFATEIRNSNFLVPRYFHLLNRAGVTHCFNQWSYMATMEQQMRAAQAAGGLAAPFFVARILTPLGVSYEDAVKLFAPYDRLQRDDRQMQRDVLRLMRRGVEREVDTYIIVNNRCESHAPGSIARIAMLWSSS